MLPQLTGQALPVVCGCHQVWDKSRCSSSCKLPQDSGSTPGRACACRAERSPDTCVHSCVHSCLRTTAEGAALAGLHLMLLRYQVA
jgi:hypothetical protein